MSDFKKAAKSRVNIKKTEISFAINLKVYEREVVYKACYAFIDKMYIFLDLPQKDQIVVYLRPKRKTSQNQLEKLRDEFLNELLNALVRKGVSHQNQKIVEQVVGGAIQAALKKKDIDGVRAENDEEMLKIEQEVEALKKELENDFRQGDSYKDDPLNIRKPIQ